MFAYKVPFLFFFWFAMLPLRGYTMEVTQCSGAAESYRNQKFDEAYQQALLGQCPNLLNLSRWRQLRSGQGALSFEDYETFIAHHSRWPYLAEVRSMAEQFLTPDISAARLVKWFSQSKPKTFKALEQYLDALQQTGRKEERAQALKAAWLTMTLNETQEQKILTLHGKSFSNQINRQRFMSLLNRSDFVGAGRQLKRCSTKDQRLLNISLALRQLNKKGLKMYETLPRAQQNDPDLIEEVLRYYQKNESQAVYDFLRKHEKIILQNPKRFWRLRYISARDALVHKNYAHVFHCLEQHGHTHGDAYVRSEWLLGFTAHRFLKEYNRALKHYKNAYQQAIQPSTKARLSYWMADAYEALGDQEKSQFWLKKAAQFPKTFYGQHAWDKLGLTLSLKALNFSQLKVDSAIKDSIINNSYFKMALLLKSLNDYANIAPFLYKVYASLKSSKEKQTFLGLVHECIPEFSYDMARLLGNSYTYQEIYPYIDIVGSNPAILNAIVRKESGFNPQAVSPAGALGLMQLMPQTALKIAQARGETLVPEQLLTDPYLNMRYGAYYFEKKLKTFEGSLELTLAGYNAGPINAKKWLERYGNPLKQEVDLLTWLELIPFTETRSYVQRVMENYRVYQVLHKK